MVYLNIEEDLNTGATTRSGVTRNLNNTIAPIYLSMVALDYLQRAGKHVLSWYSIIGAFLGTIVEYYDYALYGFASETIAQKFFAPVTDLTDSLVKVYGAYALGYLAKPVGALLFGSIGDRYGRSVALNITIIGMALPTMVIGILPAYEVIGRWGERGLMLCRFIQGVFAGGQYDSTAIYVIEHFGKRQQYMASGITRGVAALGLILARVVVNFFTAPSLQGWAIAAWRIPFLLSLPLALLTWACRKHFKETPEFKALKEDNLPQKSLVHLIAHHGKAIALSICLMAGSCVGYQIAIVFMQDYLSMVWPQATSIIPTLSIWRLICLAAMLPISGYLADKIGVIIVIQLSLRLTLMACLLFIIARSYQWDGLALVASLLLGGSIGPFNALVHGMLSQCFVVDERCRIIGLSHSTASVLLSSSTIYICLFVRQWLKLRWLWLADFFPIIYLVAFLLLAYTAAKLLMLGKRV